MPLPGMMKATPAQAEKQNIHCQGFDGDDGVVKQVVALDSVSVKKVRFEPGAITTGCMLAHVAYVLSGSLRIRMNDGSEDTYAAGDVMMLPPGHDAWTVGEDACEFVEFSQGTDGYYGPPAQG